MECKFDSSGFPEEKGAELIDTLWNVNLFTNAFQGVATVELIDTLWNVNNAIDSMITFFNQN